MNDEFENLHLGCGLKTPSGWINVDGSWNARLAKYPLLRRIVRLAGILPLEWLNVPWASNIFIHDVRRTLPFRDCTFRYIYSSHLLEHLYWQEGQRLLRDCFRLLMRGGCLRMVVPDLKTMVKDYIDGVPPASSGGTKADRLNDRLLMHLRKPPSGNILYRIYNLLNDFHTHKWMYDADSLMQCFRDAGFVEVREMAYCDSRIPNVDVVEDPGRVLNGAGICVEGIRPIDM